MITVDEINQLVDAVEKAYSETSPKMQKVACSYVTFLRRFALDHTDSAREELSTLLTTIDAQRRNAWKKRLAPNEISFVEACLTLQKKLGPVGQDPFAGVGPL